jgi:hypothetical protein
MHQYLEHSTIARCMLLRRNITVITLTTATTTGYVQWYTTAVEQ